MTATPFWFRPRSTVSPGFLLGLALAACLVSIPADAMAQILVGRIIDQDTKEPVRQAEVRVVDVRGEREAKATSDSSGHFQLRAPGPGAFTVQVTHIAYVDYASRRIPIERGETIELEIRLGRSVIPLDPLVVTARRADLRLSEYHERLEHNAFGKFVTREDIAKYPVSQVTDLFRMMNGVQVVPIGGSTRSIVTMRGTTGRCLPAVYFDGVRIEQSADFPIDDLLVPDFLEGVEVYTSVAGAPAQYWDANCGVILLWSRSGRDGGRPFSWKRLLAGVATAGLIVLIAR